MTAPIFQPDFSGVISSEIQALVPMLNDSVQEGFNRYKPIALSSGIMKEAPVDQSNKLILVGADRLNAERLWEGERVHQPIVVQNMDIVPELYELTWSIDQLQFEDTGRIANVYNGVFENVGMQLAAHPDRLAANALGALTTTLGYDGVDIASTSHPVDTTNFAAGTWSNYLTSTPLTAENVGTAISTMMQVTGRDGLPWSNRDPGSLVLVVPSQLAWPAYQALGTMIGQVFPGTSSTNNVTTAASAPNVWISKLGIRVIVLQTLVSQTQWFLIDTSGTYGTLVYGLREPFKIVPRVSPDMSNVFDLHKYVWGCSCRDVVGFAFPQDIILCDAS